MEPENNEGNGSPYLLPVLIGLALFSQFTSCTANSRIDKIEKQQDEIRQMITEQQQRR